MEPSDSREPSYYEVALTNRQVLVAFVALLTCLLAAFLSGVWIGRGAGSGGEPPRAAAAAAPTPTPEPPLEQLSFFSEREPGARTGARPATPVPAAPVPSVEPKAPPQAPAAGREDATAGEAMRQTLEAEVAAAREPAPAVVTATPSAAPTPRVTTAPVKATAAASGRYFVQVYSSSNAARAREIVAELRKAGFAVQLSEAAKDGQTSYRVRVGPFESRERARRPAERLRREFGLDTWITDTP